MLEYMQAPCSHLRVSMNVSITKAFKVDPGAGEVKNVFLVSVDVATENPRLNSLSEPCERKNVLWKAFN